MQKVAWPITIVQSENWNAANEKNELSAIPVMTPGRAIGRITTNETRSRPKNRNRATANAAIVPSTSAMPVAASAALIESQKAVRASSFRHAEPNHLSVKPAIGQLWMFEELN